MADLLLLLVIAGSFALLALLIRACDHVIGPDPLDLAPRSGTAPDVAPGMAPAPPLGSDAPAREVPT